MADGKIYITITDKPLSDNETEEEKEAKKKGKTVGEYAMHQFMHLVKEQSQKVVNYAVSNIGYYTGNYQAQRDMESAISVGRSLIGLGEAYYAGLIATKGAVAGGIVGLAVAGVSMAITKGLEVKRDIEDNRRQNVRVDRLRDISGLNGLTNGSR